MSAPDSKPGEPGYKNDAALNYVLVKIIGSGYHKVQVGIHEITRALTSEGITTFYGGLLSLGTQDCMELVIPKFDGYKKGNGATLGLPDLYDNPTTDPCQEINGHNVKDISKVYGRQLCAMLVFFHHGCPQVKGLVDV
jgi:hypothetical protein